MHPFGRGGGYSVGKRVLTPTTVGWRLSQSEMSEKRGAMLFIILYDRPCGE